MFGVTCRTAFRGGGCDVVLCSPVCVLPIIIEDMDRYLRLLDKQIGVGINMVIFLERKMEINFLRKLKSARNHRVLPGMVVQVKQ
jgi:hypothetical protein